MMSYIHHKEHKIAILGMQGKLWKKYEEDLRGSGENRKSLGKNSRIQAHPTELPQSELLTTVFES